MANRLDSKRIDGEGMSKEEIEVLLRLKGLNLHSKFECRFNLTKCSIESCPSTDVTYVYLSFATTYVASILPICNIHLIHYLRAGWEEL